VGVGEAGGTGGTEGEADAFGGREGLVHRFAAAWVGTSEGGVRRWVVVCSARRCLSSWQGIMRRGVGALVGGLGRIGGLVGVGEAGGPGGTEGEADAFGGREGLVHRFAAAWVRVRAVFGDG